MSTATLTKLAMSEGPNDSWKSLLPVWAMEVLDNNNPIFGGWREHFLHAYVFNAYVEIWFDSNLRKGRENFYFPYKSYVVGRENSNDLYWERKDRAAYKRHFGEDLK